MSVADDYQAEYVERLQSLQRIRTLAHGTLKLPQICVVGDQSSGKSSLLATCTGIGFPESSGICTRAPAVVECHFDASLEADEYKIEASPGVYDFCHGLDDLKTRISCAQEAALNKLKAPRSQEEELQRAISTDEIRVKVRGPRQMDIIVVDLPGIIHNGEGATETRDLIRKYCQPEQTLMLLVSEAKQDEESIEAIALAKTYDPKGVRSLRVLTKFDMFDSKKATERACGWVEAGGQSEMGCHAVVCRSRGADYDPKNEENHLGTLPSDHSGVAALKRRLPPLFAKLISQSLPDLQKQIMQKLHEAQEELRMVGDEPVGSKEMIYNFQRVVDDTEAFEQELAPHIEKFQTPILETQTKVTPEWTYEKFSHNPFRLTHFQGDSAVMACMEEIVDEWWRPPMQTFFESVCESTRNSMAVRSMCRKQGLAATLSKSFLETLEAEWLVSCAGLTQRFSEELKGVLEQERGFGTINHYLDTKYEEQTVLPDGLLERVVDTYSGKKQLVEVREQDLRVILKQHRTAWVAENKKLDLQDQQKLRILNAVKALGTVEAKTFLDNVVKVTRDFIIQRRAQWLFHDLPNNQKVREMAVEDTDMAARRTALKEQIASMRDCQQELQRLRCS